MIGQTGRHGGCARLKVAWGLLAPPREWHLRLEPQGQVRTAEMVIGAPPFEVGEQFASELSGGPAATGQSRQGVSQGEDLP